MFQLLIYGLTAYAVFKLMDALERLSR